MLLERRTTPRYGVDDPAPVTLGARPRIRISTGLQWLKPDKEARVPSAPVQVPHISTSF
jgi:hypothetical protein